MDGRSALVTAFIIGSLLASAHCGPAPERRIEERTGVYQEDNHPEVQDEWWPDGDDALAEEYTVPVLLAYTDYYDSYPQETNIYFNYNSYDYLKLYYNQAAPGSFVITLSGSYAFTFEGLLYCTAEAGELFFLLNGVKRASTGCRDWYQDQTSVTVSLSVTLPDLVKGDVVEVNSGQANLSLEYQAATVWASLILQEDTEFWPIAALQTTPTGMHATMRTADHPRILKGTPDHPRPHPRTANQPEPQLRMANHPERQLRMANHPGIPPRTADHPRANVRTTPAQTM